MTANKVRLGTIIYIGCSFLAMYQAHQTEGLLQVWFVMLSLIIGFGSVGFYLGFMWQRVNNKINA